MIDASPIAVLSTPPSPTGVELSTLPASVRWLEIRADLVGDISPDWLRDHFRGRLWYTLRSQAEGGNFTDSQQYRDDQLTSAARHYDRVELEGERDFSQALLDKIPAEQRCVSWHGRAEDLKTLKTRFEGLSSIPAAVYKLVTTASKVSEEFTSLSLLKSLGRTDTIAFSIGPLGFWSRVVALQLGSPMICGMLPNGSVTPADPAITKLVNDYGFPAPIRAKEIFAIIGSPIFHSLSPRLHNAAYRANNYPALFLPFHVESFEEFWVDVVQSRIFDSLGLPFNGMTVASPHKEKALVSTKMASAMAQRAESANILIRNNGSWNADTTDPDVVYMASRDRNVQVMQRRAAVIGCGGAGRAIAAALLQSGANVTLINRGLERGHYAAGVLGLPYIPLTDFNAKGYDIVVNATPVGRDSDEVPFRLENLNDEAVVIDLVYGAQPTSLVANMLAREQIAIDGHDVLVTQVLRQFQLMTGQEMPITVALDSLRQ